MAQQEIEKKKTRVQSSESGKEFSNIFMFEGSFYIKEDGIYKKVDLTTIDNKWIPVPPPRPHRPASKINGFSPPVLSGPTLSQTARESTI